jgi:hypothetical protein
VIRDTDSFEAGIQVRDAIWRSVLSADKVIAVYSKQSRTRDWPSLERDIAGMVESQIKAPLLIYLCLDNTPLKKYDQHRIAIKANGKPLKRVCSEIQKSLGIALEHIRIEYDENRPL